MADLVRSITSATPAWGQPKKQEPENQATTGESRSGPTSSASASSSDTEVPTNQPSTNQGSASAANPQQMSPASSGAVSGKATPADSKPTYSDVAEVSRMPDRLRDLIVQQRSPNSSAASVVRLFTDPLATDRIVARTVPVEETDLVFKTAQLIMGQPRKALVAQANQTPESVRALLEGE